jgi:hypothetical protein
VCDDPAVKRRENRLRGTMILSGGADALASAALRKRCCCKACDDAAALKDTRAWRVNVTHHVAHNLPECAARVAAQDEMHHAW